MRIQSRTNEKKGQRKNNLEGFIFWGGEPVDGNDEEGEILLPVGGKVLLSPKTVGGKVLFESEVDPQVNQFLNTNFNK